ncbi:MAG: hypothetical protein A3A58_00685 [Candidatus Blackburnbacteria bacterium RIFCSPLOWO2_01_FULL_41_27]|uniref:Uncharacterized protein n=2 Tax=Candidatus Blackburniibacteriota TaxID=1817898 RepID=A0A1G1VC22_9BACT|nr:MAG: hypothetical protein A3F61_00795 [Candidatus Blackburnbacteria bacterium RIFCSPHIGHO2_12_FULL_41_13b]OGY15058.1 MAG: hypothetical protein A3A58_00685 [Candidatus Blackburnbacteria bacterium RIFCSPLOWO2_01_FULL_41_27]
MNKQVFLRIIFYFISSRLIFLLLTILASYLIPLREGYLGSQFDSKIPYLAWVWANMDGRHYLDMATKGYQHTNFAFFPLYPILISLGGYILPVSHIYVGILISIIFMLAAMYIIYKIVVIDYSQKVAFSALFFMSFLPFSFFYHAVYTDSLFLFLSTASFYFARKRNWIAAGIFAGFAFLDRFSAVALIPALVVEWRLQYGDTKHKLKDLVKSFLKNAFPAILLCFLGLVVYMIYLQVYYGDFLLFQKARSAWGQDKIVFPLQVIWRYLKIFWLVDKSLVEYWVAALEFISVFVYFCLSFYVASKIRLSYGVFMAVLLLIVPLTGTFAGNPRYALHIFPAYIALALLFSSARSHKLLFWLFLILGFILNGLFTRGYFIS